MKPAAFRYHAPKTIDEAVALLAEVAPEDGRVLAGGQSLVPIMAFRLARPSHLVDINGVDGLRAVTAKDGKLSIGAGVRHAAFYRQVVDGPLGKLLSTVVRHIAHHPIRTRGTFCGSIAHADPASEWCMVAATLDVDIVLRSVRGTRTVNAGNFFEGIMTTARADDELLTAVLLTSVVLLAFLHNPRAAVIVLFSIPTTLLTTFIAMRILGFSLTHVEEWGPTDEQIAAQPNWADERQRPPFLLVAAALEPEVHNLQG